MIKIISGGQTGVDRAALDAALELDVSCGGWCPKGRKAEDGVIAAHYPLQEMSDSHYSHRTQQNVLDSDGTLIIYDGELEGGTKQTVEYCITHGKPCYTVNLAEYTVEQAVEQVAAFLRTYEIDTLNVAGPRASKKPEIHGVVKRLITDLLNSIREK